MEPKVKVQRISELTPDDHNANRGTERGSGMLEDSLRQYGAGRSILIDKKGKVIAGNKTIETAAQAGFERVIVVPTDGKTLVAVQRTDLDLDNDKQAKELAIADNRVGQVSLDWDPEVLADLSAEIDLEKFWKPEELAELLDGFEDGNGGSGGEAPEAQVDRAEELREKWQTAKGQIWEIPSATAVGKVHRVMCGDSLSGDDVARLMGGLKADLLNTDPPYGISIVSVKGKIGGDKPFGSTSNRKTSTGFDSQGRGSVQKGPKSPNQIIQSRVYAPIHGDDQPFDPSPFVDLAPTVILWGANYYADKLPPSSCWICWDKREGVTRNSFADCELAWCSKKAPSRVFHHLWNGLHKGSQHGEARWHPTEKPVALFAEIGKEYAAEGLWVDLFAGSGAQVVAAEQTGATCYALEYEPPYVAVILERMQQMGLEPRLCS